MSIVRSWKVVLLRVVRAIVPSREPEEKFSWLQFRQKVVQALPVIAITIMLVSWAEDAGWFRGLEMSHLDTMIRAHLSEMSKDIVVVEIGEDDYQKFFDGTSPLDKNELLELISGVQKYHPAVIGVDIDTSDWFAACERHGAHNPARCAKECGELDQRLGKLREEANKSGTDIVWAAVPRTPQPPLKLSPLNPGLTSPPPDLNDPASDQVGKVGIPRFPVDDDGSVRHFDGRVEVEEDSDRCPNGPAKVHGKCYLPTFARAIYEAYIRHAPEEKKRQNKKLDEQVIFNFYGDRYQFPIIDAKQFLREKEQPEAGVQHDAEVQHETSTKQEIASVNSGTNTEANTGTSSEVNTEANAEASTGANSEANTEANTEIENRRKMQFGNQVVLIGGSFPEARDQYFTPRGLMQGVELNALAIQTDLNNGGIQDISKIKEYFFDWCVSIGLVFLFYRYENRPLKALAITTLLGLPATAFLSALAFSTAAYWFNFVPVAVGVVLHQFSDMAEGRVRVQRELEKLRGEREQVEVDVATIEEIAVGETPEAGITDETPSVEDLKVKRAASGAS